MTESREPTELAAEVAMESSEGSKPRPPWHNYVAFTTLAIAVLAAAAALLSGVTAQEELVNRTEEIIDVALAQSDLERAETLKAKHELLIAAGLDPDPSEVEEITRLEESAQAELELAAEARDEAFTAGSTHFIFAVAATVFAVAIAVAGLAVIVDRKWVWYAGILVGIAGIAFMILGLVRFEA